jgi:hypothetical protein
MPIYATAARICGLVQSPDKHHLQPKEGTLRELCHGYAKEAGDPLIADADINDFFFLQALLATANFWKSPTFHSLGTGAGDDNKCYRLPVRLSVNEKKDFDSVAKGESGSLILGTARWFCVELLQWLGEESPWIWKDEEEKEKLLLVNPEPEWAWRRSLHTSDEEAIMRHNFFSKIVPLDGTENRLSELRQEPETAAELELYDALRKYLLLLEYQHVGVASRDPDAVRRLFDPAVSSPYSEPESLYKGK